MRGAVGRGRRSLIVLGVALGLAAGAACHQSPPGPSNAAPFSAADLVVGDGTAAATGMSLTTDYTGWLYDASKADGKGAVFATSLGSTPITFTLGSSQVIAGWDQGLVGMRVGGTRRLVIPPDLAYGGTRRSSIPPYATLVFEVTLRAAQ
ncbi:MAG TPA: FKBP-type peptidyl-prolyl cis-trans isomerase [Vicinamibacterales bacterium]|nr:FKBP-type peptidyl-prolyl cis-trans isomerase [Vicinamibacterales bacterium]